MHEKCKENHPHSLAARQRIFRAINKSTQQFTTPKLILTPICGSQAERLLSCCGGFKKDSPANTLYSSKVMTPMAGENIL